MVIVGFVLVVDVVVDVEGIEVVVGGKCGFVFVV